MEQQVQEEVRFVNELNTVNAFINNLSTTSRRQLQSLRKKHTSMTRRLDWEVPQTNLSAHKTEASATEESPQQDVDQETVSIRTTSSEKSKVQSEGNPRPKAMKENQVENQVETQSSRVVRKAKRGKHVSS